MFQMFASLAIDRGPFDRDLRDARREAQQAVDAIERDAERGFGATFRKIGQSFGGLWGEGRREAGQAFDAIEREAGGLRRLFDGLKSGFANIWAGIGVGIGVKAFEGVTRLGGALTGLIGDAQESAKVTAQLEAVLKSTGGVSGMTVSSINKLTDSLSALTGVDDEAITSAQSVLLTFTNIGQTVFPDATAAILDLSTALGGDMQGATIQIGKALNDPVKGITALTRVGVSFTEQQKAQIEAMVEAGDVAGAQRIILAELNKEFGGSAEAQATNVKKLTVAWGNLREDLGGKLLPVVERVAGWLNTLARSEALQEWIDRLSGGVITGARRFLEFGKAVYSGGRAVWDAIQAFRSGQTSLSEFIGGMERLGTTVLGNLGNLAAQVGPHLSSFFGAIGRAIETYGPQVAAQFQVWGGRIVGWITDTALPWIAPKLGALFSAIGSWVQSTGLPMLGARLLEVGQELGGGVSAAAGWIGGTAIPFVQRNLGSWLSAIGEWVTETAVPGVLAVVGPVGTALGGWITGTAIPYLQTNLPQWLTALRTWVEETAIPESGRFLGGMGTAFGDWVATSAVPWVQANLPGYLKAITDWIVQVGVPEVGRFAANLGKGLWQWIVDVAPDVKRELGAFGGTVGTGLNNLLSWMGTWSSDMATELLEWIHSDTTGPLWLHDWGELFRVLTTETPKLLNYLSEWSSDMGVKLHEWLFAETTGPMWLHDWGELYRISDSEAQKLSDRIETFNDDAGTSLNEWLDTAGPLWLHDWGELWKVTDQKAGEIAVTIQTWQTNLTNGFNTWLAGIMPSWSRSWSSMGSAIKNGLIGGANEALSGLNSFADSVSGLMNNIAGAFKLPPVFNIPHVPLISNPGPANNGGGTQGGGFAGGLAAGAGWRGGWAWVGEGNGGSGSEYAYLPAGSVVIPHDESQRMVQGGQIPAPTGRAPGGFAGGLNFDFLDIFSKGAGWVLDQAIDKSGLQAPDILGLADSGKAIFGAVKGWMLQAVQGMVDRVLPSSGSLTAAMQFALSQLGKPYQWGGDGNPSYDCSGFAKAVTNALGLGGGMPRVVSDIYNWAQKGKHPAFTFGFNNPTNPDPKIQHMGVGIAGPNGMEWFEAGGRAGGIGRTSDYWQSYGFPAGLDAHLAAAAGGTGGSAPWNSQAPPHVVNWLLSGLAAAGKPASWLAGADIIAYHESGYDPNAINLTDVNAQRGDPSKGLMQVISAHFRPGEDPYNPIHNVTAAARYIGTRYGDMYNVPGPKSVLAGGAYKPYARGGVIGETIAGYGVQTGAQYLLGEAGKELVIPEHLMAGIMRYFAGAITTGTPDESLLVRAGVPLEMRPILRRVATMYLAEAKKRAGIGVVSGGGAPLPTTPPTFMGSPLGMPWLNPGFVPPIPGGGRLPVPGGTLPPWLSPGYAPTGYKPPLEFMPGTTARKGYTAEEQEFIAEVLGDFLGGELHEDDARIEAAMARFTSSGRKRRETMNVGLTADEQLAIARLMGDFIGGELMEDEARVVAALAEFAAKGRGTPGGLPESGLGGWVETIAEGSFRGLRRAESLLRSVFGSKPAGAVDPTLPAPDGDGEYLPRDEPIATMPASPSGAHPLMPLGMPWLDPTWTPPGGTKAPHPLMPNGLPWMPKGHPMLPLGMPWLPKAPAAHPMLPNGLPDYGAPGAALLDAAQQITMARTTGEYYPGELAENDPAIVSAIREYERLGGHHRDPAASGKLNPAATGTGPSVAFPGVDPFADPFAGPGQYFPSGPGGTGRLVLEIRLTRSGIGAGEIVDVLETEPIELERLNNGNLRVMAKLLDRED